MPTPNTPDDDLDEYVQARTAELRNLTAARSVLLDAVANEVREQLADGSLRLDEVRALVPDWALDAVLDQLSPLDAHAIRSGTPAPAYPYAREVGGAAWIDPVEWAPTGHHEADHAPHRHRADSGNGDDLDAGR